MFALVDIQYMCNYIGLNGWGLNVTGGKKIVPGACKSSWYTRRGGL